MAEIGTSAAERSSGASKCRTHRLELQQRVLHYFSPVTAMFYRSETEVKNLTNALAPVAAHVVTKQVVREQQIAGPACDLRRRRELYRWVRDRRQQRVRAVFA